MVTRLDLENNSSLKRIAAALEEIAKLLKILTQQQQSKQEPNE